METPQAQPGSESTKSNLPSQPFSDKQTSAIPQYPFAQEPSPMPIRVQGGFAMAPNAYPSYMQTMMLPDAVNVTMAGGQYFMAAPSAPSALPGTSLSGSGANAQSSSNQRLTRNAMQQQPEQIRQMFVPQGPAMAPMMGQMSLGQQQVQMVPGGPQTGAMPMMMGQGGMMIMNDIPVFMPQMGGSWNMGASMGYPMPSMISLPSQNAPTAFSDATRTSDNTEVTGYTAFVPPIRTSSSSRPSTGKGKHASLKEQYPTRVVSQNFNGGAAAKGHNAQGVNRENGKRAGKGNVENFAYGANMKSKQFSDKADKGISKGKGKGKGKDKGKKTDDRFKNFGGGKGQRSKQEDVANWREPEAKAPEVANWRDSDFPSLETSVSPKKSKKANARALK